MFIDAEKKDYVNYYNLIFDKIRSGGYILADNVLWHGRIFDNPETFDKETKGIATFNKYINEDKRVENMILPIRDGIMLIRKL